jgi:hypothetical protein
MKKYFIVLVILFAVLITNGSSAQCSDAGICSLVPHLELEDYKPFSAGIGYGFGYSGKTDDISYHSININAAYSLTSETSLNLFLPYNSQSGPLGSITGVGDFIVGVSQGLKINWISLLQFSAGVKFATGEDNVDNLPQKYQSGLGSTDILLGVNYRNNNFSIGIGYQVAGERNSNIIQLKRGDDLLVSGEYSFLVDEFTFSPKLLIIKRLGKSSIDSSGDTDGIAFGEIPDSDQLQINFLLVTNYKVSETYSFSFDFAIPFLKREVNVDGLTRAFSASLVLRSRF